MRKSRKSGGCTASTGEKRCEKAKAYLAGCVMLGSALEALLILMVNVYHEAAMATGRVPTKGKKPKPLLDWDLAELLKVAKATGWLPAGLELDEDWNSRKAKVGDHAEVVRMVRNLPHPGRYRKEHFRGRITRKYLGHQFEVVDACREWLADHNAKSILARMREEEENAALAEVKAVRRGRREVLMKKKRPKRKLVSRKLKKYLIGGDAEPLRGEDFRSARLLIPPRAFAYVKKFRVALDPVDLKTWTELQAVPDDVCLQTTEYHGSALKLQQELHSAWIEKIGFTVEDSLEHDALNDVAFEVEAEWQASTFASAHGFYRQAIETLRAALERTVISLRYQDEPCDLHFKNWHAASCCQ